MGIRIRVRFLGVFVSLTVYMYQLSKFKLKWGAPFIVTIKDKLGMNLINYSKN